MGLFDFFKKEEEVVETVDVMTRQETLDFVSTHRAEVDYKFDLLREELMDQVKRVSAIVDPAPASLTQQQILDIIVNVVRTESVSKDEMLMMREDLLKIMDEKIAVYDVDEDAEMAAMMDQKLEHLEVVAEDMEDSKFAKVYNQAVVELKTIPNKGATVASVRKFLINFVELLKP